MIYQVIKISGQLEIKVIHAKPIFGSVEFLSVCPVLNWSRGFTISGVCVDKDAVLMKVGICECKQKLKISGRSKDEAEMLRKHRFWGTSANNRSMPVWTLGLVFGRVGPLQPEKQKYGEHKNKQVFNFKEWMGKKIKRHTNLG